MTNMIDTAAPVGAEHPLQSAARDRRDFIRRCTQVTVVAAGAMLLDSCGSDSDSTPAPGATPSPTASLTPLPVPTPGPTYTASDADRINFLLQVDYLVAEFLSVGVLGQPLPDTLTTGAGSRGTVSGGSTAKIADSQLADILREIAYDLVTQVATLRDLLGGAVTARPAITISGAADGPFTKLAPSTVVAAGAAFDPYGSELNFLLAATALLGVSVTAYHDVARLLSDTDLTTRLAGIMAARSYHDAAIRYFLYFRGLSDNTIYSTANDLSNARNALAGGRNYDQGIGDQNGANVIPSDDNQGVLRRPPEQVLNVLYINNLAVNAGGFFPAGINGLIRYSGASNV